MREDGAIEKYRLHKVNIISPQVIELVVTNPSDDIEDLPTLETHGSDFAVSLTDCGIQTVKFYLPSEASGNPLKSMCEQNYQNVVEIQRFILEGIQRRTEGRAQIALLVREEEARARETALSEKIDFHMDEDDYDSEEKELERRKWLSPINKRIKLRNRNESIEKQARALAKSNFEKEYPFDRCVAIAYQAIRDADAVVDDMDHFLKFKPASVLRRIVRQLANGRRITEFWSPLGNKHVQKKLAKHGIAVPDLVESSFRWRYVDANRVNDILNDDVILAVGFKPEL